ncbi:MAG: nicotinate-nucleotide--dimethylbenzimidazole phosphoribosyltransferase [Verrucomicrobiota bacterium]
MEITGNQIKEAWSRKTVGLGSLGRLEELATRLSFIQQSLEISTHPERILIFAGTHGISQEGVSSLPPGSMAQEVLHLLRGGSAISVLCKNQNIDLQVIDTGVDSHWPEGFIPRPDFIWKPIRRGTRNFLKEPAMLAEELETALELGREQVRRAAREGIKVIGLGELGVGGTTASSAICCALLQLNPVSVVGRGAGLSDETLNRKIHIVHRALTLHQSNIHSPIDWLRCVGGFEIAAMTGAILEAKHHHMPMVIDGIVSTASAVAAFAHDPTCRDFCFFSHLAPDRGHHLILQMLGVEPLLDLKLAVGEGIGVALAIPLLAAAANLQREITPIDPVS